MPGRTSSRSCSWRSSRRSSRCSRAQQRDNESIIGRIIAGSVEAIWTTMAFLLLPAIIIEDAGFGAAMKRMRALHQGHMLMIGIGEVGVRAVTALIGFIWFLLIFGL